jgi:hypothetical protein
LVRTVRCCLAAKEGQGQAQVKLAAIQRPVRNPLLKRIANGVQFGPVRRYAVHFRHPGISNAGKTAEHS